MLFSKLTLYGSLSSVLGILVSMTHIIKMHSTSNFWLFLHRYLETVLYSDQKIEFGRHSYIRQPQLFQSTSSSTINLYNSFQSKTFYTKFVFHYRMLPSICYFFTIFVQNNRSCEAQSSSIVIFAFWKLIILYRVLSPSRSEFNTYRISYKSNIFHSQVYEELSPDSLIKPCAILILELNYIKSENRSKLKREHLIYLNF
jgi:hypothetical protein